MKFLFITTDLSVGGVTASLQNISSLLVEKGHCVEILSISQEEETAGFDKSIKFVDFSWREKLVMINKNNVWNKGWMTPVLLFFGVIKKALNKGEKWLNFAFKKTKYSGYDAVIAFKSEKTTLYLTTKKTKGARKYCFWHGDIKYLHDISEWECYLNDVDGLACVSDAMRDSMKEAYPNNSLSNVHQVLIP